MLRKFNRGRMTAALGAILTPMLISGWGHTTTAYFVIGLASQSMGAFIFPFALGSFHQALTEGKGMRRTGLLYIMVLFSHPYYGYFLGFLSVMLALIADMLGRQRKLVEQILSMQRDRLRPGGRRTSAEGDDDESPV